MDISLYYQSYGNGFPLVLLHGNGETAIISPNKSLIFPGSAG